MADPIIREMLAEQAYGSIYSSQYADAQKSARANEIARRVGIDPGVVEAALPDMMAEDRLRRATQEAQKNHAYARLMANQRLAAAGIDDEHLPTVAREAGNLIEARSLGVGGAILQYGKELVKGFGQGSAGFYRLTQGAVESIDQAIPDRFTFSGRNAGLKAISRLLGSAADITDRASRPIRTDNRILNDIYAGAQSVGPSAMALALTAITRKPIAAASIIGAQTAGQSYQEGREVGLSPIESLSYGAQQAVPEIGFEAIGGRVFSQSVQMGVPFARTLARQLGIELVTELPTTAVQSLFRFSNIGAPKEGQSVGEWLAGLPDEELSTAISVLSSVGFTTSIAHGATKAADRYAGIIHDRSTAAAVDRIMAAAAQSSTRQSNPSDFEEALNQLVVDSDAENLYIPADKVQELFQDDDQRNLHEDPFWSQYAGQVEEAAALGGDVVIPLASAATHLSGSADWGSLREFVRTRPSGASLSEAKQADSPEELEKIANELASQLDERLPQLKAQQLTKGFASTLGYEGEQADSVSGLLAAAMTRAHAIENAKRAARGEGSVPIEDFAHTYLPQAARMTQAEYDGVQAAAAQSVALNQEINRRWQAPDARQLAAGSATLDGGNSNSPYMVIRGADEATSSPDAGNAQEADAGGAALESGAVGADTAASAASADSEGQLEFFPGADFVADPKFFGSTIEVDGVERPTVNADDQPIAQTRAAIEAFWRWFGDSKAIDNEGRPIVFYHGTSAQFEMFDPDRRTFFFAIDRHTAENFGNNLITAYLRVTNPDEYDANHNDWSRVVEGEYEQWQIDEARSEYVTANMENWEPSGSWEEVEITDSSGTRTVYRVDHPLETEGAEFAAETEANEYLEELQEREREAEEERLGDVEYWELEEEEYLSREGIDMSTDALAAEAFGQHDAVWIENVDEGMGSTTVVIVLGNPTDIKHTANFGTFDPNDPSILRDTFARGNISIQRDDDTLMSGAIIRAFEAANFSTAVHELGHFFLEDLRRRALSPDATEQERADWQAFKDWALNDLDGLLVGDDQLVPTEAHESWARGFERYIYEGKAPSSSLTRLFSRMRDFMLSLYRSLRGFNAPITPEIRQVMDRLLASDEEIAAQSERLRLNDEALADLMSADEQTRYAELGIEAREAARDKLFERVLSTLRAEKARGFREQKRQISSEVQDSVDSEPVFQALRLLRGGIPQDDGTTVRGTLPRQWLVDTYGEDIIDQLPKSVGFPIIDDAHAVDPEVLAVQAGFDSADAMVNALKAHEQQRQAMKEEGDKRSPRQALIDAGTEQRVREELGDPFENLEEEAEAALANEKQADRISLELRALARKAGKKPTAWKAANDWARNRVRSQSTKEAISGSAMQMYSRAAAKAAQRVEEALAKQDFDEAFLAKQQQVLNLALMAQAKQAKDEVDKAVRRLQRTAGRATIPSVDQDYLDQAHQLLEAVDMRTRPQTQIEKRMAFEAWYASQVEKGVDVVVPPEYARSLGQANWSRLAISELLELDKAVGQVIELGRLKQRLKDGKKSRDYNEGVAEMKFSGGQQPPRTKGKTTDPSRSLPSRLRSKLRMADAAMIKVEQLTTWLDNDDPNGPWTRYLFRPLAEAQGRETDLLRDYTKEINALIKAMPKAQARRWTQIVDTPELVINNPDHLNHQEPWIGTKDQVVAMALNWGNEQNRQRLLDGFGWNEGAMEAVFDRLMTKEDWDFVQSVWDTVDKLWPDIAALEREVNGVAPEKVEASEVQTRHGAYRGGYFPIVYDPTQSTRAAQAEEDKLSPNGGWFTATTRSSATKARVEAVKGRPLLLSMSVITRHVGEVVHDITHRQAVSQVKKLLSDSRIHSIINSRLGPEYSKAMGGWIENIARPNTAFSKDNPALVALGRHLNKGVSLVGLGFRVTTSLVQLLGIPVAGGELGSKYLWNGVATAAAHPVATYREVVARSAEMRGRFQTLDAVIDDMIREQGSGKLQVIGPKGISKYAFQGIAYMDMVVTTSVWTGAFNKGLSEGMTEEEAAFYGDKVVRMTQGTGGMKDRAAIQNAHPLVRALYPFFSYMNALYNMQRDVFRRVAKAETLGDYGEAARRAWWVMAVPTLIQALIFGNGPDDDDDEVTAGDWAEYLTKSVILGNLGSLPLIGNLASALGEGYTYRSSAYQQIGEGFIKGISDTEKLAAGEENLKGSTIQSVLTTVGLITARPLGQIGSTSRGIYDLATGEAEPEDAGDVYELLTKGRISREPTAAERIMGET